MSKVFITGIAGFLGSHLADFAIKKGDTVVGCDNLFSGDRENVPKGVEFHEVDCLDLESMKTLMANIDVVYHCACAAYEGLSVVSPSTITNQTFQATSVVLSAAMANEINRFVYCSSMARYGEQEIIPFTEEMNPQPVDPYGIAKLAAENLIKNLCSFYDKEYTICVPHNVIGPRQKYNDPYRNVASIMIHLMLNNRQPFIYGDGSQKRCFTDVDDVIPCLYFSGFCRETSGEVINIGPDERFISILELAELIANKLNVDLKPTFLDSRPGEVRLANCSANKARSLLDFSSQKPLEDSIDDMIDYISKRGSKKFEYNIPLEILSSKTPRSWKDGLF